MHQHATLLLLAASLTPVQAIPNPIICEDTLDGSPAFDVNKVPCLLGCGSQVAVATGSLLPGSVNLTEIPYCELDCVHADASPAQSAAAPDCYDRCQVMNQGTPENVGWCMFWCVEGYTELVETTACVPSLEYGALTTTTIGGAVVSFRPFTEPTEWQSWYLTQTVLPRTGVNDQVIAPTSGITVTIPASSGPTTVAATWTAPFRPSAFTQETQTSASSTNEETQTSGSIADEETQTSVSIIDEESAMSTATRGESVTSPTPTGSAMCLSGGSMLQLLSIMVVLVMMTQV
ncbi:hypothetical protein F4804DRAFT_70898 [Jackrogersella minutella]|nr:hypothetical protein F4804DRAFT_70898 [Jackrogersella minutella]